MHINAQIINDRNQQQQKKKYIGQIDYNKKIIKYMNVNLNQIKRNLKPDLYILIKKDNLSKLQSYKANQEKRKSIQSDLQSINHNQQHAHSLDKIDTNQNHKRDYVHQNKTKVLKKNSQVSIHQDFIDSSLQPTKKSNPQPDKQYTINVSTCPILQPLETSILNKQYQNEISSSSQQSSQQFNKQLANHNSSYQKPQNLGQYKRFRQFFQYVLDFKMMKIQSYDTKKHDILLSKLQDSINHHSKNNSNQLKNSLTIYNNKSKQAEKNINSLSNSIKFQKLYKKQHKDSNKSIQNQGNKDSRSRELQAKQSRNRQLQNSQISLVDVRISSASMEQFNPIAKNYPKRLNSHNSNNQMKKNKKVYFDFENPQSQQSDPQQPNLMVQSQNNATTICNSQTKIVSLQQLKKRIYNSQQEYKTFKHHGFFCDQCKVDPIVGKRYRCIECDQYDLCQKCYKKQCQKYGKILNKYSFRSNNNINTNNNFNNYQYHSNNNLFQLKPLLKKQMSDIVEQDILSQNRSSEENIQFSQQDFQTQNDHVHLMEEVQRPKPKQHINFQKILKQTNRGSLKYINQKHSPPDKNNKLQQNETNRQSSLAKNMPKSKLLMSVKNMNSKLTTSTKSVSSKIIQMNHRNLLQSKRKQLEYIRKSTQSIKTMFK